MLAFSQRDKVNLFFFYKYLYKHQASWKEKKIFQVQKTFKYIQKTNIKKIYVHACNTFDIILPDVDTGSNKRLSKTHTTLQKKKVNHEITKSYRLV